MSSRISNLSPELVSYVIANSSSEVEELSDLRQDAEDAVPGLQIFPEQARLLSVLVRSIGAKRTLDIGTFRGYSALAVALALPEDGLVISCEVNSQDAEFAMKSWKQAKVEEKVELHLAPALETLDKLIADSAEDFDFALIDADKRNNQNYYERCLSLIRPGGLIAIDNTLWGGKVLDTDTTDSRTLSIQAFNEFLSTDQRVEVVIVPFGDGLTLAVKK